MYLFILPRFPSFFFPITCFIFGFPLILTTFFFWVSSLFFFAYLFAVAYSHTKYSENARNYMLSVYFKIAVVSVLQASISVHSSVFCDKSEFELFRLKQVLWQVKRNYSSLIIFWLWLKTFDVNRSMKEEAISNTSKYGGCNRHWIVSWSFRLIVVPPEVRHHLKPSL